MAGYDGRGTKFPLTIVRGADLAFELTVLSGASPVNLSSATIAGNVYDTSGTLVDTLTAAVSGAGSNVVTLSFTDTETAALTSAAYRWTLWVTRGGDKRPWLAGPVRVVDSSDGGPSTSGTTTTLTVDGDLSVAVDVAAVGSATSTLDDLSDVTITTPLSGNALTYNGSAWVNAVPAGGGDMLKSENLSGLANTTTARSNLGLGTAAITDATDYDPAGSAASAQAAAISASDPVGSAAAAQAAAIAASDPVGSAAAAQAAAIAASQPADADLTTIAAANNGSVLAATTASFLTADDAKLASLLPPLVRDSFNRADSPTTMGNTDTAQTWTLLSGGSWSVPATPYGISGNLAYLTAGVVGPAVPLTVVETGMADCTIQVTIDTYAVTAGICFRAVDIDNHLIVDGSGIYKRVSGNTTRLGAIFSPSIVTGDVLRLVLNGSSIKLYVNDVLRHDTSSTSHQTATKHGLRTGDGATRFNDFSVHPLTLTPSEAAAAYQPLATVLTNTTASYTTAEASKLSGIEAGAQVNVGTNLSWTASTSVIASDTGTDATLTAVDGSNPGLMTVAMKSKLDGIEAAADVTDATNVAAAGAVMESDTSTALMSFVIDEDNMATDSATKVPTQQSVKAYADLKVAKATFPDSVTVALSDMTTQITTGTVKAYWVNPFDTVLTITKVKATLATAGSGSTVVDINEGAGAGTSILSTKITIEASETDSDDATTPPVVSDASIAADGRLTFDIDTAGTSAAGLQVTILFTRAV